jgi:hypothetical protein
MNMSVPWRNTLPLVLAAVLSPPLLAHDLERVVVPVAYSGPGGYGAFWVTAVGAWNRTSTPWATPGVTFIESCPIPEGCETEELGTGRSGSLQIVNTNGFQAPQGFILYVPSESDMAPALWARFSALPSGPLFGVELPLPHEDDFRSSRLRFPSVPIIGSFRTLLRVYGLDVHEPVTVRVIVPSNNGAPPVSEQSLVLRPSTSPEIFPSYSELALHDSLSDVSAAFLDIEVVPEVGETNPAKIWAFISVTAFPSNEALIITPR